MSRKLTASDRKALIKLAYSMDAGTPERRAIMAGLKGAASSWRNLERRLSRAVGWDPSQPGEYTIFLSEPDEDGGAEDGEYIMVDVDDLRGSGDMIEAYDYAGRRESVPKKLIQKALKTRKLEFGGF